MSLVQTMSTYLTLNLMIVFGFIGLRVRLLLTKTSGSDAAIELKLHYATIAVIGLITLAHPFFPRSEIFRPAAKVWSAQSIRSFPRDYKPANQTGYIMVPALSANDGIPTNKVTLALTLIAILVIAIGIWRISRDLYSLARIRRHSFQVRKIGAVNIFMNDEIKVPFSFWLPGRADIVIPSLFLSRQQDYKMAVAHELQHHRQGDTRWVYVMCALKVVCPINPFVYLWTRWASELQEFACDDTLVNQKKVESQQYARCLVEVAETANSQRYQPGCATGLLFLTERNLLKRRIERMINGNHNKTGRAMSLIFGLAVTTLMVGLAYASKGLVQDRRVAKGDAQRLAAKAQQNSEFPVVVNDLVLKQLNRYIGTPEGREFMRNSLQRMENYRKVIEEKINSYRVPNDLMAVPIIESGYQNLTEEESNTNLRAAGLWQFIPSTAHNYGLRIDAQRDERLNVMLASDAALRYLKATKLRFNDWLLAVLAFNAGERAVQKGINETGSRDAWTLIRDGYEGDKDYLPKLIAAIIIMRNPETVE